MTLAGAYQLLQRGEAAGALAALDALGSQTGPDEARRLAWRAQALRALGRAEEGAREVIAAIRVAKALGDAPAVAELRALHADLARSVAALRAAEAGARADQALAAQDDADLDADARLRKALVLHAAGDVAAAARLARAVAAEAAGPKEQVLARLALARIEGDATALHEAHALADAADDQNLLTAVAQTARQLGLALAAPEF